MGDGINQIHLSATLVEKLPVRYTPAGIEVFEARMHHEGAVYEAQQQRRLSFDFQAVAFAEVAGKLNRLALGSEVTLCGFIAPKSLKTQKLVVHITEFKI